MNGLIFSRPKTTCLMRLLSGSNDRYICGRSSTTSDASISSEQKNGGLGYLLPLHNKFSTECGKLSYSYTATRSRAFGGCGWSIAKRPDPDFWAPRSPDRPRLPVIWDRFGRFVTVLSRTVSHFVQVCVPFYTFLRSGRPV